MSENLPCNHDWELRECYNSQMGRLEVFICRRCGTRKEERESTSDHAENTTDLWKGAYETAIDAYEKEQARKRAIREEENERILRRTASIRGFFLGMAMGAANMLLTMVWLMRHWGFIPYLMMIGIILRYLGVIPP